MKASVQSEIKISNKQLWINYIHQLQIEICSALEKTDGKAKFITDNWQRPEGGGGITRVISDGSVFEKGGVNTSVVFGDVTQTMKSQLKINGDKWFACGLSLVIHPLNPYVPTVHANWRYFELYDARENIIDCWFGGGTDLTPNYLFEEDAKHFHSVLKSVHDKFDNSFYPKFKKQCDEYFVNHHRNNEMRGIGGVFYDYIKPDEKMSWEKWFSFQQQNGNCFLDCYLPIVEKRKSIAYTQKEIDWQELRRGRYSEFNLVHDRGTLFGLKTNGRTESILMSLPPRAQWKYNYQPEAGSEEEKILLALKPTAWI